MNFSTKMYTIRNVYPVLTTVIDFQLSGCKERLPTKAELELLADVMRVRSVTSKHSRILLSVLAILELCLRNQSQTGLQTDWFYLHKCLQGCIAIKKPSSGSFQKIPGESTYFDSVKTSPHVVSKSG